MLDQTLIFYQRLAKTKCALSSWAGISRDALQVHFGLVLFFILAYLLRRHRWGALVALDGAFVVAVVNEASDTIFRVIRGEELDYLDAILDLANTVAWPFIVTSLLNLKQASVVS